MKTFVLVLNGEASNAKFISNSYFDAADIKPIWCEFDIELVEKNKDMTSHIVIFLPENFTNDFQKLLFYVRDLCIDEEKTVYLYGSKSAIDSARAIIPNIFMATKCDSAELMPSVFVKLICGQIRDLSSPQKTILMLNDGTDYFKELSLMLRTDFNVILSKLGIEDVLRYISIADIMLISVDTKMSVLENGLIFEKVEEYQRKGKLKLIFVANDTEQQTKINVIKAQSIICLSKATETQKVANYLRKRYLKDKEADV